MQPLPYKNIVFFFSDPAGANACVSMARMEAMNGKKVALFSNRNYMLRALPDFTVTEDIPDFNALPVDCVFTGTSHPDSSEEFEIRAIKKAKAQGIPVISFIDHWVNFRLRFRSLAADELPDQIWVVDEQAKELGIQEGLPAEKMVISGNPHLYFLKHYWQSGYIGKNYLATLGIPVDGYHVLFVPDPLTLRNDKEKIGFTETEALSELCEILAESDVQLLIKCHPLQPVQALQPVTGCGVKTHLLTQADSLELVHASDVIVGFYSNLLLEAEALGRPVVRYFPGRPEADLLKHNTTLKKVESKGLLQKEIHSCLYG